MLQVLKENKFTQKLVSWLGLFTSMGTLLCCALPSTLILLGFGATLASFLGHFPALIWLSEHKAYVFIISFFMLGISYFAQKYSESQICPIDKKEDCESTKSIAKPIFWTSVIINLVGVFYAYILPRVLVFFNA